jgi:predicted ribosome quality control (RQC) complex YloA/Tae2 family protein
VQLVPGKVQKVSAFDGDVVVVELFAGKKVLLWVEPGRVRVIDDVDARPRHPGAPPALQGLLRKELIPAILTAVDDAHTRFVFARKDQPPRTLLLEPDGKDPRWVLLGPAKDGDGERILATGPATRATDGRDLRRGRLYEPPRSSPTPMTEPSSTTPTLPTSTPSPSPSTSTQEWAKKVKAELAREVRKRAALLKDRDRHGDPAALEHEGELLKTVLGVIKRGQAVVDVVDFDGAPQQLTLDPQKDARQNLAARFSRAKKARTAQAHVAPRLVATEARIAALEAARSGLLAAGNDVDAAAGLVAAAQRLVDEGGGGVRRKVALATAAARSDKGARVPYRSFLVGDGAGVLVKVGKGAKDNDALVKGARGNDWWCHARDATGAHVVVGSDGGPVVDDVVRDAALLAVWFSTKRGESSAIVQCTRVKHLKKPGAGAPAGLWLVGHEETRVVRHDAARVHALLAREVASS